jgi:hypothetical protein
MKITEESGGADQSLLGDRGSGAVKVTISPSQPKTLTHLPRRPPVDIAFTDLSYSVSEGSKSSKSIFLIIN